MQKTSQSLLGQVDVLQCFSLCPVLETVEASQHAEQLPVKSWLV